MRLLFCSVIASLLTAGCVTNLSHNAPYEAYLNQPLPLRTDMRLARGGGIWPGDPGYSVVPWEWKSFGGDKLPAGTPVTITSIIRCNAFDTVKIEARGRITVPYTREVVRFSYLWGTVSVSNGVTMSLNRAPWEDSSIPERRDVGWNGRRYRPK